MGGNALDTLNTHLEDKSSDHYQGEGYRGHIKKDKCSLKVKIPQIILADNVGIKLQDCTKSQEKFLTSSIVLLCMPVRVPHPARKVSSKDMLLETKKDYHIQVYPPGTFPF